MTRYRADDFADVLASLKGDCVGVAAIDAALRAISNRYVDDGYVTSRAFVGPQDLARGVLTITVIEGRVDAIRSEGATGKEAPTPERQSAPYGRAELIQAFPIRAGALLDLRALEQGVDQLARMAKAEPFIDIEPGAGPGASAIVIRRRTLNAALRPGIAINNDGAANTGRWQGVFSLDADSPLGIADVWSVYYQRNLD